jgi:hypothetical protein
VAAAVAVVGEMLALRRSANGRLGAMGQTARSVLERSLSQQRLCGALCDRLEGVMWPQGNGATATAEGIRGMTDVGSAMY